MVMFKSQRVLLSVTVFDNIFSAVQTTNFTEFQQKKTHEFSKIKNKSHINFLAAC